MGSDHCRVRGCPRGLCGLFGLENTSKVTSPRLTSPTPEISPFPAPVPCQTKMSDPILPQAGCSEHSRMRCCSQIIHGISFILQVCVHGWPRRWGGLPQCSFLPSCWNSLSRFPGTRRAGNLHAGSPTPRPAGCVCSSFPPAADKGSLKGNPAQEFITGIMPQSQRPREPGKTASSNSKVKGLQEEQLGTARPSSKQKHSQKQSHKWSEK